MSTETNAMDAAREEEEREWEAMREDWDNARAALERLAQAMPLADPNAHLGEELHARINYAREALKR